VSRDRRDSGGGSQGAAKKSGRRTRRSGSKRRRKPKVSPAEFWGDPSLEVPAPRPIEVSDDPASVVRSLGPPPLAGQERAAEAAFELLYDRAVSLAGALAAAGGLLADDESEGDDDAPISGDSSA
jgi:hypothetical protein